MADESGWAKFWKFLWEDNSPWSWLVNIILAFVLIKFIVYPGIGVLLGTQLPVVAVVSGSMEHAAAGVCLAKDDSGICVRKSTEDFERCGITFYKHQSSRFDDYWGHCGKYYVDVFNISKAQFQQFPFPNGFNTGDVMLVYGKPINYVRTGDVIIFKDVYFGNKYIIHRVVNTSTQVKSMQDITTKGDHNGLADPAKTSGATYYGVAVLRIPFIGYIKLFAQQAMVATLQFLSNLFYQ
ncbi:MAG TPA: signal peptidase I [Acidobacteriota bacterium]|nr:signal peptidase I [Acidobacteriota bacterium]